MAETKKYWYIQLDVNFFENEVIDWLCEQKNGYEYVVLYIKLCLKTSNTGGFLTRQIGDMVIPYDFNKIAEVTKMKLDTVIVAFELFKKTGLIYKADEDNNLMRIPAVEKMVGYTTQFALDKAKQREKKKQLQLINQDKVQDKVQDTVPTRDKSIELRVKSLDKELKSTLTSTNTSNKFDYDDIVETFNSICVSFPKVTKLSEARKKAIKARLSGGYSKDDFEKVFSNAENSDFLKGKNTEWQANFDWLIKETNMIKVLEGNYANKDGPAKPQIKYEVDNGMRGLARLKQEEYEKQRLLDEEKEKENE